MTFQRTGRKLLAPIFPKNPIHWVVFLLQGLGRLTYKSFFYLLESSLSLITKVIKFALIGFYRSFYRSKFIFKKIEQIISFGLKLVNQLLYLTKLVKAEVKYQFWLGKQKKPLVKVKLPKLAKRKVTWPKISLPKIAIPKFALVTFSSFAFLLFIFYFIILKDLPSPNRLATRHQAVSTKILDRNGKLLYTIYNGNQNRTLITLDQVPQTLKQATIAMEDRDFYHHQGFSARGIARAIQRNVFKHSVEGGSTITQQLVKNALLSPEKTLTRKLRELILALEVELLFPKDEILQMYFNEIPYGGTAYGVEAAAKTYFGKSAKELDLAESALLAGLSAAPTHFSPFGANPKTSFARQKEVLKRMVEDGYITANQAESALQEKIVFAPQATDIRAPHFVMFTKDLLVKKYGQRIVEEGGLEVITSLDLAIQEMVEKEVKEEVEKLTNFHVTNGAVLVTNPETGEILAMVGSKDYFDVLHDGNVNVTTSFRQPGSSIKVANYAVALQSGYTSSSIISDTPIVYKNAWETYAPINYDGRFHGNVTLRTALGSSYNVPAVKVLASYGVERMRQMGKIMGITTWEDSNRFGLSLTLGGGEVKMVDLAVVYGTLANMGKRVDLYPILKVTDYKGRVLENSSSFSSLVEEAQATFDVAQATFDVAQAAPDVAGTIKRSEPKQVLPPSVAYLLSDILSDNNARTPAFGPNSYLVIPDHQVAVKTGTTNDKRDNWTIGYTSNFVVAVWVGNNDNSPMSAIASGVTGASPIWHQVMRNLLAGQTSHHFEKPQDVIAVQVCSLNGLLPCEGCPTKVEYFLPGTEPRVHCTPEAIKKLKEEKEKEKDKILEGISTQR